MKKLIFSLIVFFIFTFHCSATETIDFKWETRHFSITLVANYGTPRCEEISFSSTFDLIAHWSRILEEFVSSIETQNGLQVDFKVQLTFVFHTRINDEFGFSVKGKKAVFKGADPNEVLPAVTKILSANHTGMSYYFKQIPMPTWEKLNADFPDEYSPVLSPLGDKLVFKSWRNGFQNLWILDLESNKSWQSTFHNKHIYGDPTWSPDGERIGYITDGAAYILDLGSGETKKIAKHSRSIYSLSISFSPEKGRKLVNLNTDEFVDVFFLNENNASRWYLSKFYSNREERFSQLDAQSFWSPSGKLSIVFLNKIRIIDNNGNSLICFNSPQEALRRGNQVSWALDNNIVWSSDERLVFFSFNERVIYCIDRLKRNIAHFFSSANRMQLLSYNNDRKELVCFRFNDKSICSVKRNSCEQIIQVSEMFTVNLIDRIKKDYDGVMGYDKFSGQFDRTIKQLCFFSKDQQPILAGWGLLDFKSELKWNVPNSDFLFFFTEDEGGTKLSNLVDYIEKSRATDFSISRDKQTIITVVPNKSVFSIKIKQINELQN